MDLHTGWQYRTVSSLGAVVLVVLAVAVANHPFAQDVVTAVPLLDRLEPTVLTSGKLALATATALVVLGPALMTLFKPRPRRILDTISLSLRRVLGACLLLATIGYFDYTYRLPRTTLLIATALLCVWLPAWFVTIRRQPATVTERAVLVGDDPEAMQDILKTVELDVVGYLSPTVQQDAEPANHEPPIRFADGGTHRRTSLTELRHLGGLSRLDEVFAEYDVGTAVLAFERPDRAEFFGALSTCHDNGVVAKVHRRHADSVLTSGIDTGELVDVELEPWDWQDRLLKRGFDVVFAAVGLALLSPLVCVLAVAIKLDSHGPVFYRQERTAEFGETFHVYKFRSMVPDSESSIPVDDRENDQITRVGRILRQTHLDEIPQLGAILLGNMSVVGPRAVWTDEEEHLEAEIGTWRKRWFVKPGLTGLAQIHDVSSTNPRRKFRYDLKYIKEQSFWFDLQIVMRQVWMIVGTTVRTSLNE